MTRAIVSELVFFFLPFAVFALILILRKRNPFRWSHWSDQALWLVIAGLVCVGASLIAAGVFAERHNTQYVPPHMEDGRLVPGQFR